MELKVPIEINAMDVAKEYVEKRVKDIYELAYAQGARNFAMWINACKFNYAFSEEYLNRWLEEFHKKEEIASNEPIGHIDEVEITEEGAVFKGTLSRPVSFLLKKDMIFNEGENDAENK